MKVAKMAALTALIAAGTIILPAPAQAAPPPLGSGPVTASASSMLTALSQYLKLPLDQARTRWRQERQAATTDAQLKRRLGNTYLGSWLSSDGQLHVAISDHTKAAMVRLTGAHPMSISSKGMTLRDAVKLLSTATRPTGFVSWYPDWATNSVVVSVTPGSEATARTWLKKRLGSTSYTVRTTTEIPRPMAQHIRGGVSITIPDNPYMDLNGDLCSIGFAVKGGFVTAGHCGKVGNSVETSVGIGDPIGKIKKSVDGPEGDFAFVETYSTWTLMAEVFMYDHHKTVHVDGSAEAPVGAAVCRSGQTTGWHCGTILAKDAELTFSGDAFATDGLTMTDVCSEDGDSGGPFIADGQAQGTLVGGPGGCKTGGGGGFFQPINEVLTTFDLELLTENEEEPWEPDPGFGPCC